MREAMDIDTDAHEGQPSDDDTRMTRRDEIPMIGKKTDAVLAEEVPTKPPFIYAPGPLPDAMRALDKERQHHQETKVSLLQKQRNPNAYLEDARRALDKERKQHQETNVSLLQKQKETEQLRQSWRDVAGELSKHLRQAQGVDQLTDDELKQRFRLFNECLGLGGSEFDAFIEHTAARIDLMQAFLWWSLTDKVFKRYQWPTRKASEHMQGMSEILSPLRSEQTEDMLPDARRKFHMWRANTSNLIINAMSLDKNNAHDSDSQFVEKTARDLTLTLSHFSTSDWPEIETGLVDLIYKSLDLDAELSRQVASITFSSSISLLSQPFHSDTMVCVSNYEAKDGDSKYVFGGAGSLQGSSLIRESD
ncbi:hypothetical protein VE00_03165 [Pseudogymnoascus sp. WSF 3629]|nr:hypothetical protein VE00_03165 [Pseudogymnoascus sp. WSF 3629]